MLHSVAVHQEGTVPIHDSIQAVRSSLLILDPELSFSFLIRLCSPRSSNLLTLLGNQISPLRGIKRLAVIIDRLFKHLD